MDGTESEDFKGPTGVTAPFFKGVCSFLSRRLVRFITETDWAHTVMVGQYGTAAADANTGKWVQHAVDKHEVQVDVVTKAMVTPTSEMERPG